MARKKALMLRTLIIFGVLLAAAITVVFVANGMKRREKVYKATLVLSEPFHPLALARMEDQEPEDGTEAILVTDRARNLGAEV
jgi:hypothetical protein